MKQGSFPCYGYVVRSFFGTMNPSDSLSADVNFAICLYDLIIHGLGPLQFQTALSIHAVSSTPKGSLTVLRILHTFQVLPVVHGLRLGNLGSAPFVPMYDFIHPWSH